MSDPTPTPYEDRFNRIDERLDRVEGRLERVEQTLVVIIARLDNLDSNVKLFNETATGTLAIVQGMLAHQGQIIERMNRLERR